MEVKFHLPGLRQNFPLNMLTLSLREQKPEYFREGIQIASFFGEFPTSLWNGADPPITTSAMDPWCNFCMQAADNGLNEVIIFSPLLEKYIRETYPQFKINSSTCKEIREIGLLNEELKKDYALVVLDYNFNNRFEELAKIEDKSRCEILINAVCIPDCPRRGKHYRNIAKNQRIMLKNRKMPPDKQIPLERWHCEYGEHNCIHTIQGYNTYISPEAIWEKYVPMGFHNFKIEGRTANLFSLVETYCHYLIRPEYQGQTRILLLNNLVASKVLTINRPRPAR